MPRCVAAAILVALGLCSPLSAAPAGPGGPAAVARLDAVPVTSPNAVRVHGDLSADTWSTAPAENAFVEREPMEGGTPSQRTEFRVAYDETTLYVRVKAFDTDPSKIVGYLTRRDVDSPSDWIRVLIDSYHDRRTAYEFAVNPAGVKLDRYWFNDFNRDDSWDAVWDVSVSRDADGWSAEFRIPFSQLRFNPRDTNVFGFAVVRQIGRLNETSTWPLLPRSASGYVSSFGELGGLSRMAPPRRLELMPYTVGSYTSQPKGGNPLVDSRFGSAAMGLDLKYAVTPGLTLTSTMNPDFGQVEADPSVVNLTAFETFYSERRPFFVEGSGNFRFDVDCNDGDCTGLFYSRRIGRTPQGNGDLPSGDHLYTNAPSQTRILGATKLTGRIGSYSIGVMDAVTQEQFANIADGTLRYREAVEPLTNYAVARVRREFANQSSLGFVATATNRRLPQELLFLPSRAFTGGTDVDWRLASRYSLQGYLAASLLQGDASAIARIQENSRHYFQRPGFTAERLDVTRTSLDGTAGRISIGKISGERVRFSSNLSFKTPGFDINDIGFLRRSDSRSMSNWLQIRSDRPTRWFRSRSINFNEYASWNFDGDRLWSGGNINGHLVFHNNWRIGAGFNVSIRGFDDRLSRGGPGGLVEGMKEGWYFVNTDDRRKVSLGYNGGHGRDATGSGWTDYSAMVTYRPIEPLSIAGGARLSRSVADAQWVNNLTGPSNHYVFGRLDQTTVALTGRLNYTMSPTLSLQLYAQPFVSGGTYTNFRELADGRNPGYSQRYTPFAYDIEANGTPDFNVKSFKTTNVLRWEYKPGSTLFVVWQQARENDDLPGGPFRFGRDLGNVFSAAGRNVFLVKVAYWLNY